MLKRTIFAGLLLLAAGCVPEADQAIPAREPWEVGRKLGQPEEQKPVQGTYAMAEVRRHRSEKSCWLVLNGKVYDVTAFIPFHPGGEAILEGCGKDATRLFETRPMGSGTPHSSLARQTAEKYLAGTVQ